MLHSHDCYEIRARKERNQELRRFAKALSGPFDRTEKTKWLGKNRAAVTQAN